MRRPNKKRLSLLLLLAVSLPIVLWFSTVVAETFKAEWSRMEIEKDRVITDQLITESGLTRSEWLNQKRIRCVESSKDFVDEHGPRATNIGLPYETAEQSISFFVGECVNSWNGNSFIPKGEAIANYAKLYWLKIFASVIGIFFSSAIIVWFLVYGLPAALRHFISWITKPE